mgnify:CR=1 FL=1
MQIPENELNISFARSSGKGGQNVNKTSTKVFIHWPIGKSVGLTDQEKARVREKLANRINNEDELVVMSEEERSQPQNREIAIARLQGYRVAEVPVVWNDDPHSTLSPIKDGIAMIRAAWHVRQNIRHGLYKS